MMFASIYSRESFNELTDLPRFQVLSSPVRDENRSLCKFKVGEMVIRGTEYVNGKMEYQLSVQSLLLEDTRVQSTSCIKR